MKYKLYEVNRVHYRFDMTRYFYCMGLRWMDDSDDYSRIQLLREMRAWVFEHLESMGECAVDQKPFYQQATDFYFMTKEQMLLFKLRWA